jgi:NTE family protein
MPKKELKFFVLLIVWLLLYYPSQAQEKHKKPPTVGLVLSGGGARGFAHIGVIKVLEEEGIDVDVIGGTSMGSIVGGLYAMGYSIDTIEKIAKTQDWNHVLNDLIDRKELGFYEKFAQETHIVSLAIKDKKVNIPPGLVYGQNVTNLLTYLTAPAYHAKDFKDLHKPFVCIATDLLSGKAIVMDTGNLAIAIRASMSVPSAFVPVKYGPYYLVDGGLVNNLPAKEVRALGADVLIGVDIQTPIFKQEEIKNLVQVLSQSIFLNAEDNFNASLKELDLLIKPDIDPFTAMDFDKADSLIARGEKKAREMIPLIRAFMDSAGIKPVNARRHINTFPEIDKIYVNKVVFVGNEKISEKYLTKNLDIHEGDQISLTELKTKIDYLYGSKLFQTIHYSLKAQPNGETTIIIELEESSLFDVSVGAHYNDYAGTGLLVNLTGRNIGVPNGRLAVDVALGKVNRFSVEYVMDNGLKPGFGMSAHHFNQFGYSYDDDGKKLISFNMNVTKTLGYALLTVNNILRYRLGYELEINNISQNISLINFENMNNLGGILFSDILVDTYDRYYLPKEGYRLLAHASYGVGKNTDINLDDNGDVTYPVNKFSYGAISVDADAVVDLYKNFIARPSVFFYSLLGDNVPLIKTPFFGGFSHSYFHSYQPFPGYGFMEITGSQAFQMGLSFRYNFWHDHFLSAKGRILSINFDPDKSYKENQMYSGWQLTYSYYSKIGPISVSLAEAYPKKVLMFDFSLGFWF